MRPFFDKYFFGYVGCVIIGVIAFSTSGLLAGFIAGLSMYGCFLTGSLREKHYNKLDAENLMFEGGKMGADVIMEIQDKLGYRISRSSALGGRTLTEDEAARLRQMIEERT